MTKAEQIEMLESKLKAERLELEKARFELAEYKKREESFVWVENQGSEYDGFRLEEMLTVYACPAKYGAGVFDHTGFHKALDQFVKRWNIAATEACLNDTKGIANGKEAK